MALSQSRLSADSAVAIYLPFGDQNIPEASVSCQLRSDTLNFGPVLALETSDGNG